MIGILLAILMAAAAGAGGVAIAADGAGPGDALYGVDQTVERVSLGLTANPERAVEKELAFAEERLDEAEGLADEEGQEEDFEEAIQNYGRTISQIVHLLNSSEEVDEEALNALLDEALAHHEERLRRIFDLQDGEDEDGDVDDGTDLGDDEDAEEGDVDDDEDVDDEEDGDDDEDVDDEEDGEEEEDLDEDDADEDEDGDDEDEDDDDDDEDEDDDDDDEDEDADDDEDEGDRCTGNDPHPAGEKLAAEYDVEYDDVMGWFCDGYGFGEIVLAIEAADQAEMDIDEVLDMKGEQGGWGRVMQELGLIGKNRRSADDEDEDEATEEPDVETTDDSTEEIAPRSNNGRGNGNGRENAPGQNKDKEKSNNGRGNN